MITKCPDCQEEMSMDIKKLNPNKFLLKEL